MILPRQSMPLAARFNGCPVQCQCRVIIHLQSQRGRTKMRVVAERVTCMRRQQLQSLHHPLLCVTVLLCLTASPPPPTPEKFLTGFTRFPCETYGGSGGVRTPGPPGQLRHCSGIIRILCMIFVHNRGNRKSKWNLESGSIHKCYRKCTKSRAKRLRPALVHLLYISTSTSYFTMPKIMY